METFRKKLKITFYKNMKESEKIDDLYALIEKVISECCLNC